MRILPARFAIVLAACIVPASAWATTTIDPVTNKYAYGANIGWVNAEGDVTNGMVVGEAFCSGFLYGANVGWIGVGDGTPDNGLAYSNSSSNDYGVNLEADGDLRGFAYAANLGWINFESNGNAQVDLLTGNLSGSAYGANVGWISLSNAQAYVQTVSLEPGPDSEPDMLPDAWELIYTNDLGVLDGLSDASDADADGASDKEEYLAGTNPLDANSHLAIVMEALDPSMAQADVTWNSVATRLYRVELNNDLGNPAAWADSGSGDIAPSPGSTTTETVPIGGSDVETFRVNALRPLAP
jgi:hypothetical protein